MRFSILAVALMTTGCATVSLPNTGTGAPAQAQTEAAPSLIAPAGFVVEGISPTVWHAMKAGDRDAWLEGSVTQAHTFISRSSCGAIWRKQQACTPSVTGTYHLTDPGSFRVVVSCAGSRSTDVHWFVRGDEMAGPDAEARPHAVCSDGNMAVFYGHTSSFAQNDSEEPTVY